jgi:hypothetical protein
VNDVWLDDIVYRGLIFLFPEGIGIVWGKWEILKFGDSTMVEREIQTVILS